MGRSWCVTMALVLSALGASVHADVAPGDKIDATNVAKAKDLISPGLEWCIKHGFPITIGETQADRVAEGVQGGDREVRAAGEAVGRRPHRRATTSPASRSRTSIRRTRSSRSRSCGTTSTSSRTAPTTSTCATSTPTPARSRPTGPMTVERHFLLDHLRRLFWTGRLYVDPEAREAEPERLPRAAGALSRSSSRST